ncbi:uncharacterized protein LOC103573300 isoform X2 [Microplitis demolitor]|uniref:uncharacterized protein LOC103573300 isoform X2 n=1 Tax=Microplitis demolitor TaxID=69319 RepID=UPI0004CD5E37|nr:uncharacterized protein LOC103573300 isoform X2 [Microplitis demolitor]
MDEVLPFYVQKSILDNIKNLIILLKIERVHKTWYNIVHNRISQSDEWREICLKHISTNSICTIMTRSFPRLSITNFKEISDSNIWFCTFRSYRRWLLKWKFQINHETIDNLSKESFQSEKIICTAIWDKYFAVGTTKAFVHLFNIDDLSEPFLTIDNKQYLSQIIFWYPNSEELILVTRSSEKKIKFWNSSNGTNIPTDHDYKAKYLCVGTMNNFFGEYHDVITEYERTLENVTSKRNIHLHTTADDVFFVLFSQEEKLLKLLLDSLSIYLYEIKVPSNDKESLQLMHRRKSVISNIIYPKNDFYYNLLSLGNKQITKFFLRKNKLYYLAEDIAVLVSENNQSILVHEESKKWKEYNPFEKFTGIITSAVLHGKTFIFGIHTGEVQIYVLENLEQLKSSQLNPDSSIKYKFIQNEPIISLNITETQRKLYILASTRYETHVITFF